MVMVEWGIPLFGGHEGEEDATTPPSEKFQPPESNSLSP